jgi:hypothetical protein
MSFKSQFFPVLVIVMLTLVGCTSNEQVASTPVPVATPTPASVASPTALAELTLGEAQTIAYNGFSFRPVEGWSLSTESNSVSMEAPDAKVNAGPGFFITGGYLADFGVNVDGPVEATEAIIQSYVGSLIPVEESYTTTPRRVAVAGVPGNDMDFVVPDAPQPYMGRITVLQDGNQIFLFLGLTPPERWNDEFKPLYEEVLRATRMVEVER